MAIFFSCCPWQISQNVRVAPAPVLANHRNNNSGGENNIATRSKTDVEMLKNNQKSSTQSTQARKEKVQLISLAEESSSVNAAEINLPMTGHCFKRKTFHKPTYCHHCSDLLWGLTNQGLQCSGKFSYIYNVIEWGLTNFHAAKSGFCFLRLRLGLNLRSCSALWI